MVGIAGAGPAVAQRLLAAGHTVRICADIQGCPAELRARAALAARPADAVAAADLTVVCVGAEALLQDVVSGPEGIARAIGTAGIAVDHGPTSVAATRLAAGALAERGAIWVDAPLATLGRPVLALGCPPGAGVRLQAYLDALGIRGLSVGSAGSAQLLRLVEGLVAAITLQGTCEGLRLALAGDLDLEPLLRVLRAGSGDSTALHELAAALSAGDGGGRWNGWPPILSAALEEVAAVGGGLPATALTLALAGEHTRRRVSIAGVARGDG